MTKIDIISGFLGAGKTTLIKKLLSEGLSGEQVVLIENEFGEIGIDGGFLEEAGIQIREMNSGCICCSLVGDFGTALGEVIHTYHPDRIIIEPSGVGKLSDVIKAVQGIDEISEVQLNSFTTVADVNKCKMYMRNFGEFFDNQIQYARTIILSRTDTPKATPEKIDEVVAMIRELNPTAAIITTPITELSGAVVLETMEKGREDEDAALLESVRALAEEHHHHDHDHHHHHDHDEEHEHHHDHDDEHEHHHDHDEEHEHHHDHDEEHGHHHHHHHHHHGHDADEVFVSWGAETPRKYTRDELESCLTALDDAEQYGLVLRAKGMIPADDGTWLYFDMVPGEHEIRTGQPEVTGRLCVIGSKLSAEKLNELFHAEGRFSDLD